MSVQYSARPCTGGAGSEPFYLWATPSAAQGDPARACCALALALQHPPHLRPRGYLWLQGARCWAGHPGTSHQALSTGNDRAGQGRAQASSAPQAAPVLTSEVCFCHSSLRMGAESNAERMAR